MTVASMPTEDSADAAEKRMPHAGTIVDVDAMDPSTATASWNEQWPGCPPIGYELRHCRPDQWVRFHSLPGSKRYADNPAEYAELLYRHHTLLRPAA